MGCGLPTPTSTSSGAGRPSTGEGRGRGRAGAGPTSPPTPHSPPKCPGELRTERQTHLWLLLPRCLPAGHPTTLFFEWSVRRGSLHLLLLLFLVHHHTSFLLFFPLSARSQKRERTFFGFIFTFWPVCLRLSVCLSIHPSVCLFLSPCPFFCLGTIAARMTNANVAANTVIN